MYTYNIRSVVGVYTPVGVVTEWLWSVHSKLECTLRQGKGWYVAIAEMSSDLNYKVTFEVCKSLEKSNLFQVNRTYHSTRNPIKLM